MDKVKARFVFLTLVTFLLIGVCHWQPTFAAESNQTAASAVSQSSNHTDGLPLEDCPKPESSFWPWKMIMRLDAWVKKNLW